MSKKRKPKREIGKKRRVLSILALVLLLCVGLVGVIYLQFFVREVAPPPVLPEAITMNFHFRNADGYWGQEERQIAFSESRSEIVESVLQSLVEGPRTASLMPSLPDGIGINDARLHTGTDENVLEITFAPSFANVAPLERIFTTASFVWTLTELDFVHHLLFYVGNYPMLDGDGNVFGLRNRQNTTLEDNPPWEAETTTIALYFPDDMWMGLVAEEREIPNNPLQDIERAKIAALIEGPQNPMLYAVLPPYISYNRIERQGTGDTIIVDFGEDFLAALSAGGSLLEEMIVFSLVNTLTERPEIGRVQITIDGMQIQPDESGLHMDLSRPIERDESIIIQLP